MRNRTKKLNTTDLGNGNGLISPKMKMYKGGKSLPVCDTLNLPEPDFNEIIGLLSERPIGKRRSPKRT